MIYLIEYDRKAGTLVQAREFPKSDRSDAEDFRLELEIQLLESSVSREVVLLEASSMDELRRTHRRYFERLEDLVNAPDAGNATAA